MVIETCLNPDRKAFLKQIGFDLRIVRAEGHYLYTEEGDAYLDMVSQAGSVPFGGNPSFIWDAVNKVQAQKQANFIQPFTTQAAEELATALVAAAPGQMSYVTFTNSGAETVEVAIKLARSATQRPTILSTKNGFHGKTLGALSATGKAIYQQPFLLDTKCFEYVAYGDLNALKDRLVREDVAAFIVEPVQGEGGMIDPPSGYLPMVAQVCRQTGTLLVLDEIQTGLGRTGYLFAAEHEQVEPDIILLAKALGGGLVPIGACLCNKRSWTSAFGSLHSSTFANNQISCSVGLAVLHRLQQDNQALIRHVREQGKYLRQGLMNLVSKYPNAFRTVTGRGFMQGLQLAPWDYEKSYYMSYIHETGRALQLVCAYLLYEHKIATFPTLNRSETLRLEPPLTIDTFELDRLLSALDNLGNILEQGRYGDLLSYVVDSTSTSTDTENKCLGKFAFFAHPSQIDDLFSFLPVELQGLDSNQKDKLSQWLNSWSKMGMSYQPAPIYHIEKLRSKTGGYVEGWIVCNMLTPQQIMRLTKDERAGLIESFINISRSLNVDIIGLGGFSAVITNAGEDLVDCGFHVTSGNSLTAMASTESLKDSAKSLNINLENVAVGVIGAAGSVGYLVCKDIVFHCKNLTLFGNPRNPKALKKLKVIAGELYQDLIQAYEKHNRVCGVSKTLFDIIGDPSSIPNSLRSSKAENDLIDLYNWVENIVISRKNDSNCRPIQITVDLEHKLPDMSAVISATSQGYSFIDPSLLAPNAIVCDAARPPDVVSNVKQKRNDVLVYEGGLIRFPEPVKFGASNQANQPVGVGFACLVETIVLAMSQVNRNYSIGRRIPYSEAKEVLQLAKKHGFEIYQHSNDEAQKTFKSTKMNGFKSQSVLEKVF